MTKLSATGASQVYSTYLGGSGADEGHGVAVDGAGAAYVAGTAAPAGFPTTAGSSQTTFGGSLDAFVTKLSAADPTPPPTITITRPTTGARYSSTQDVTAVWSCAPTPPATIMSCTATDNGSPQTNGGALPHALGSHTFTVTAGDSLGATASATRTYTVKPFPQLVLDDDPLVYLRLGDLGGASPWRTRRPAHPSASTRTATSRSRWGSPAQRRRAALLGHSGYGFVNGVRAPTDASTLLGWVRFDEVRDSSLIDHGHDNALYLESKRFVFRHLGDVVRDQRVGAQYDVVPAKWYMVVGRWDGQTMELFVAAEGESKYLAPALAASGPSTRKASGISTFYVGYGQDHPWLRGSVDEVGYFDRALSDTHVAELWLADPPARARRTRGTRPRADARARPRRSH